MHLFYGGIYSKVFKYITLKKGKNPPSQERYLDWKKSGIQKLGNGRFELAHAAIILSPCGIILYAEIKQNAVWGKKERVIM